MPGPRGLPYFGCLNGLLNNPMRFWTGIAHRYGPIARVPLKGRAVFLVSDPDLLYELLITKRAKYRKNIRYKAAVDTFGAGLLLNEGDAWRRQRKMTQPTFKTDYVADQAPTMIALGRRQVAEWRPVADRRGTRDVAEDFLRYSQLVAGHYLLGPDFDSIENEFYRAAVAVKDNWPLPPRNVVATLLPRPKRREQRLEAAIQALERLLFAYFERHRATGFRGCGVLERLVRSSREQGDEFDDRSLRDQVLTLFFAGHETSAMTLTWTHYLLSEHTDVRRKLQSEVADVCGGRDPEADDLPKLSYTEQVINESLRLHSPIHSVSRVALEDDKIGGYEIPKGATIYVSLYAMHRLPRLWPDPERFDPSRFAPDRVAQRSRFSFVPFVAGHRNCVGGAMAMAEVKLAIAQFSQHYDLDLAPGHRVEEAAGTVMHPRYGMRMRIRHRASGRVPESRELGH